MLSFFIFFFTFFFFVFFLYLVIIVFFVFIFLSWKKKSFVINKFLLYMSNILKGY